MIYITDSERAILRGILARVAPGCEVRVFGSRCTGSHKPWSDLDVAVVAKTQLEDDRLYALKEAFAESDLPFRVDVLDWHRTPQHMREQIGKHFEVLEDGVK